MARGVEQGAGTSPHRWAAPLLTPPPELAVGHPCSGAVSVTDVKLRLNHTMTNTDGGKKVTAALSSTGRAMGGAVTSAKGALSTWWGGWKAKDVPQGEGGVEVEAHEGTEVGSKKSAEIDVEGEKEEHKEVEKEKK